MSEQIGNSPAGVIEKIPNLAYRTRARYWRPVKDKDNKIIDWIQTEPLPADVVGQAQYLSKGFRLDNPKEIPVVEKSEDVDDKVKLYQEIAQLKAELAEVKSKKLGRPKKEFG